MKKEILDFYKSFSQYTNPGLYKDNLKKLPDNIHELGFLVRNNFIHRATLEGGNTGTNEDMRFGDMSKVPWYRQPEDDNFPTAGGILTELFRRDERGFVLDREEKNKMVLTCRFLAITMASILKSKGIPARVRSGHAPYFIENAKHLKKNERLSYDHRIVQYFDTQKDKWTTIDVDGSLSVQNDEIDPYDIKDGDFDFPAKAWLDIRQGKDNPLRFFNAKPERGHIALLWSFFYDFHSLMNNEIIYFHNPVYGSYSRFPTLSDEELGQIDNLANFMIDPDANFDKLKNIFDTDKNFRLLQGGLI